MWLVTGPGLFLPGAPSPVMVSALQDPVILCDTRSITADNLVHIVGEYSAEIVKKIRRQSLYCV